MALGLFVSKEMFELSYLTQIKGKKLKIVLVVRMAIPYTERKKRKDEGDNKMGLLNGFSINDTEHE